MIAGHRRRRQPRQRRHLGRAAPEAADPDRIVGIALLELDPHARADHAARANMPIWMPATGTQGIAQVAGTAPATSGTMHLHAAHLHRVDVVDAPCRGTCRRYCVSSLMPAPSAVIETRPLRVSVKLCLNSPRLIVVVTLLDVVQPVEGEAGAAHADQAARLEQPAVAQHVERAGAGHRVLRRCAASARPRSSACIGSSLAVSLSSFSLAIGAGSSPERRLQRVDIGDRDRDRRLASAGSG